MQISYSRKLKKTIENDVSCLKKYGKDLGLVIIRRKKQLIAATCLEDVRNMPGRHHELTEDRKHQISCTLSSNYRLIYTPDGDPDSYILENKLIWEKVLSVKIIEISNHYE